MSPLGGNNTQLKFDQFSWSLKISSDPGVQYDVHLLKALLRVSQLEDSADSRDTYD